MPKKKPRASERNPAASVEREPVAKTPWHEHKLAIVAITALFALLGSIGLAIFNSWRAPKTFSATVSKLTVEPNVPLSDYVKNTGGSRSDYTEAMLAQVGYVIYAEVQLVGFKGRTCKMRWEAHDNEGGARISFPDWCDEQTPIELVAEAESDMSSPKFWVPPPPGNKTFFVRVMIDDDKQTALIKTPITLADTGAIRPPLVAQPSAAPSLSPAATFVPCPPAQ